VAAATWAGSTGALNTAVGALQTATGALDTAVGNLNTATGALNTAVGDLQTATGALNTVVGELNTNALRLTGGIMSGTLTNEVALWLPVNGIVYFGTTTNYIQDLGGTNFLFRAGTNWAIFGW
jgi:hypothetical protein